MALKIPTTETAIEVLVSLQAEADLKAAEARADESQRLADSLLAQHYEEWVPHWVADGYERVRLVRH
jgi:plasmid maintenance system antidote protein VapI